MANRRDSRRAMHVRTDIALLRQQWRSGVETHAYRHLELAPRLSRRSQGAGRGRKYREESVTLRVDLDSAVALERRAKGAPVLSERRSVFLRPEFVQEARRPLDVREEESDGAARQLAHAASLRRRSTRAGDGAASQPSAQLR